MNLYEELKIRIANKEYSMSECVDMLNAYLLKKQLTTEEYKELMDLAIVNRDIENEYPELKEQVLALGAEMEGIKTRLDVLENKKPSGEVPEWQKWNGLPHGVGGVGIYMKGERVKRNGQIYESGIDHNTYDPAEFGIGEPIWRKVTSE